MIVPWLTGLYALITTSGLSLVLSAGLLYLIWIATNVMVMLLYEEV